MKKILILLGILLLIGLGVLTWFLVRDNTLENEEDVEISEEEEEFNESGRAKAIEGETDLWQFHEDANTGFSIKYPHDVEINKEDWGPGLYVASNLVEEIDGPSSDFPLEESKKVVQIGDISAESFLILGRFEVCDVTFERKLKFVNNGYDASVVLMGDKEVLVNENQSEYFTTNEENCGNMPIWDFDKQGDFFKMLEDGNGPEKTQEWFDLFNDIVGTIEFYEAPDSYSVIQGRWISVDDNDSVIEFIGDKKIDYYQDEEISEREFEINENNLIVRGDDDNFEYEIVELSDEMLELIYLPRGNTLRYTR